MPAIQRGQVDQIGPKRFRLRWYDHEGNRHAKQPFASRSAAWTWYRERVEPELNGEAPSAPELTLAEFVSLYLERHAGDVRPRTIKTLRERLSHAVARFGNVRLRELERMTDEVAAWRAQQPSGVAYGRMGALRQCLSAGVRWGYMSRNPAVDAGKNRQPAPRTIRVFTFEELDAITAELSPMYQPLPQFAAATGLRPEEWQAIERRDIDRQAGVLNVRRTVSSGEIVELGKTSRSRRQVPLSARALAALDALPPRLDVPLLFPSPEGRLLHIDNFRYREWRPSVEASGIARPARIYDTRHTFASNAIAAGIGLFELARVMGTSPEMIERVYGTLLDGATESIAGRLNAFEASQAIGSREMFRS